MTQTTQMPQLAADVLMLGVDSDIREIRGIRDRCQGDVATQ